MGIGSGDANRVGCCKGVLHALGNEGVEEPT